MGRSGAHDALVAGVPGVLEELLQRRDATIILEARALDRPAAERDAVARGEGDVARDALRLHWGMGDGERGSGGSCCCSCGGGGCAGG
eukprot:COSAG04_NODE_2835_length_3512_cov_1.795781_3_plen_88_part_00